MCLTQWLALKKMTKLPPNTSHLFDYLISELMLLMREEGSAVERGGHGCLPKRNNEEPGGAKCGGSWRKGLPQALFST